MPVKTIGIELVAAFAARAGGVPPEATMTAGLSDFAQPAIRAW